MNKIDKILMTLSRVLKYRFEMLLYFFMFKDYKDCNQFCPTCKYYKECVETTKATYKAKHGQNNS